jgi:radical SAM protein
MVLRTIESSDSERGTSRFVYARAPMLVYWEMTRACDLACRHCRATAIAQRDTGELDTAEGLALLEKIRSFSEKGVHIVLTGGDPLKRPDLFTLVEHAAKLGLAVSISPSSTNLLDRDAFQRLKDAGVESLSLSLDGSNPERHEGIRGVSGCFGRTLDAAWDALRAGLRLQINTLVSAETVQDLDETYGLLRHLPLMRWKLFTLIGVGRGRMLRELSPEQCEALHHWLCDISKESPFPIATTEAPHFRRVVVTRMRERGVPMAKIEKTPVGRGFGIRDGNGILFISNTGDVYPSGFLPLSAGNIRSADVTDIYRDSKLFRGLRVTRLYKGKCGRCEFREICGGSRARAYAHHGDPLASDPLCAYEPPRRTPAMH